MHRNCFSREVKAGTINKLCVIMKELLTITIILASTFTFGQNIDTSNIKKYVIGGRVV